MAKFCGKCGAPLIEGSGFCGSCGAAAGASPAAQQPAPQAPPSFQPVAAAQSAPPAAAAAAPVAAAAAAPVQKGSSGVLKIVIGVVAVLFVCGAMAVGAMIYIGHKVSQKAHEYKDKIMASADAATTSPSSPSAAPSGAPGTEATPGTATPASADDSNPGGSDAAYSGDACKLLSKDEVGQSIGVPIANTESVAGGCTYFAVGTAADMAAKHMAALVGAQGGDKKAQGMAQQFAGAIFSQMPKDTAKEETPDGKVPVFNFTIDGNAKEQMHLNATMLGRLGSQKVYDGIGDEAFSSADSMMMVRKGDKLIRIMYTACPCNDQAIKPLAKKIADAL